MAVTGIIGMVTSLLGTAASGVGSAIVNRNRRKAIADEQAASNRYYLSEMFSRPDERSDSAAYLQQLDRRLKRANEISAAKGRITGATPEQAVAQQENSANAYADAVSRLAALGQQRRDMLGAQKRREDNAFAARRDDLAAAQLESWGNLARNAAELGGAAIEEIDWKKDTPEAGSTAK